MEIKPSIKSFFQRTRRPGDLVFAVFFLVISLLLLSQLTSETKWFKGTKLFTQPAFWPGLSVIGMCVFALGHCFGSLVSNPKPGRAKEVMLWVRSVEFAAWFMVYVFLVPILGYLSVTLVFVVALVYRVGYRKANMYWSALAVGAAVVVVFKAFLQVKIPGSQIYEGLPDGLRNIMLLYF